MEFASGVEVFPLVPVAVGFVIAALTTPAGISGAFLLLPFQFSVLGFTAPGVTPTNLIFNVVSTPGGIVRYRTLGNLDVSLVRAIAVGAVPGVVAGSLVRVTWLKEPGDFKVFVGCVLVVVTGVLLMQLSSHGGPRTEVVSFRARYVVLLATAAGTIGGIYGVSGGSIVAPTLAGIFRLPVKRVAPAALVATLITSVAGVLSYEVIGVLDDSAGVQPDWLLGFLFGIGGAVGGLTGARINALLPELRLKILLAVLATSVACSYIVPAL